MICMNANYGAGEVILQHINALIPSKLVLYLTLNYWKSVYQILFSLPLQL